MKTLQRTLLLILVIAPLTVTGAIQQFRVTWNPLPADQTVLVECQVNGGAYSTVGQSPGTGNVTFSRDVNPGDSLTCRAWATKTGFTDSARSEVVLVSIPLSAPSGVAIQAVP